MRPRRPRSRAIAAIATAALLASGCSAFNPVSDVQTKKVSVDLTFGAKVDEKKVVDEGPLRPLEPTIPTLPPQDRPDPIQPPPPTDICPPPTAIAPKYIAPPKIKDGVFDPENAESSGNIPPEEKFFFFFSGNRAEERYYEVYSTKTIDALGGDSYPGGWSGVHYRVSNQVNGVNLWFSVIPQTEDIDAAGGSADGLFLRRIEIPQNGSKPGDDPLVFSPASAETSGGLRMLHFPIQSGKSFEDQSHDVATKAGHEVPGAGRVYPTSSNTLTSLVTIGGKDIFPVCDQLAQAWKVSLEVRSVGEYSWTMIGTFWLGTHIGGWPLKSDFVFLSEDDRLMSGNFTENMARLDPGDFI